MRSSLHSIQLLAVLPSPLLEKYGTDTVLEPFMTAIQELEKVNSSEQQKTIKDKISYTSLFVQDLGVTFNVGHPISLQGSLIQCCSDIIAARSLGGFKQLHSALESAGTAWPSLMTCNVK